MRTQHLAFLRPPAGQVLGSVLRGALIALAMAVIATAGCKPTTDASGPGNTRAEPDDPSDDGADDAPVQADPTAAGAEDEAAEPAEEPGEPPDRRAEEAAAADRGETASGGRVPLVPKDHDQYSQVEGKSFDNSCNADADCHVGGCSSEICSAEPGVTSPCIMPAEGWASAGGSCGCLEGTCRWYSEGGSAPDRQDGEDAGDRPDRSSHALDGQGAACRNDQCPEPLTCVKYYGVAGPQGPEFSSCEIPCPRGTDDACPKGQTCVTIADGPGQVCRASSRS